MLGYLQNLLQVLDMDSLLDAALRVVAVLLCLTVHETCHGLAAYRLGDPTAKSMHRLSFNPLRHIDWLGLAGTALGGPVSNLRLAALAMGISKVIYLYAPYTAALDVLFVFLLYILAPLSVGLGLFNLLPIPPLDGSKVLGALLPDETYFRLMRYERYGMILLLALSWFGVTGKLISGAIQSVYLGLLNLFY